MTLSEKAPDGTTPKTDAQGHLVGGSVSGSYETHDVEQVTRATVEGTVKIRNTAQQQQDVTTLNRDAEKAQVIVKDEHKGTKVYVSDTAIKEIATGFAGIRKNLIDIGKISADGLEKLPDVFKDAAVKALALVDFETQTPEQAAGTLVDKLTADGQIDSDQKASVRKAVTETVKQGLEDPQISADLASCSGKRSFLHELLFPSAHANGAVAAVCAAGGAAVAAVLGIIAGYNTRQIIANQSANDGNPGMGHNGGPPLDNEQANAGDPEGPQDPSKILRIVRYGVGAAELFDSMRQQGIKFRSEDVVAVGQFYDGRIVFLEKGNEKSGLEHIIQEHAKEFLSIGVPQQYIPNVVLRAVTEGKVVGIQGTRPIYELVISGQVRRIAVTVGSNGYIVGANPAGTLK